MASDIPWLTLAGLTIATLLWLFAGPAPDALVYDRSGIAQGQWWRLATGHLVHSDPGHALWDIAALGLLGLLLEGRGRLRLALVGLAGLLAVDAGLWWGMPGIDRYCGLSGLLNSLVVVVLADHWRRHALVPWLARGLVAKLAAELATRQSLVLDLAWASLPEAHVAGCAGGLVCLALIRLSRRLPLPGYPRWR